MKYKIGIFGSSAGGSTKALDKAQALGNIISQHPDRLIVVTGACPGIPYVVAKEVHSHGVEVWGFSPARDEDEHLATTPDDDRTIYDKLQFVPADIDEADNNRVRLKYRNVTSTSLCDAGIIVSGRWGSLNEFTNLIDMQKIVGVLTGTGGAADLLPELTKKIFKEIQGPVVFDDDPNRLLEKVLAELEATKSA